MDASVRAIVDTVGVAFAGSRTPQAIAARNYAEAEYGRGPAAIIGDHRLLTPRGGAFVNAVSAHALDFDDTCYAGICHGSAVIFPAVLATGQSKNCSGEDLIRAFAIGSEVAYALGDYLGNDVYYRGWFNTSMLGAVGAAAGVAALLNLGEQATAAAISNAMSHCGGSRSILGSNFKPIMAGQAAALGVESAYLAASGLSASPDVLEHRFGLAALTGADTQSGQQPFVDLGQPWRMIKPGLAVKRYPVCSAAQASIEAALFLSKAYGIDADDIEIVDCFVPHLVGISLPYIRPQNGTEAQFSLPFAVACALTHGGLTHHHLAGQAYEDLPIKQLAERVVMHVLDEEADPLAKELQPEGARVVFTTKRGNRLETTIAKAYGMPARPFSTETLEEKFMECTADSDIDASKLLKALRDLPTLQDISRLLTRG